MEGPPRKKPETVSKSIEKQPAAWLDMEREDAFHKQTDYFEKLDDATVRNAFLTIFNPGIPDGKPLLTVEDIKSLTYVTATSEGSSQIADYEIKRPVFYFHDISDFQNFYERLVGRLGSGGFHLHGSNFGDNAGIWNKTGIMVITNNRDFVTHEVRHTIDPHVDTREGANNMLSETFAYYQEMILDAENGKRKLGDPINGVWNMLESAITSPLYYDEYFKTEDDKKKMSYDQFKQLGAKLVGKIRTLHKEIGALETQRRIVQATTIEEMLAH